YLTFDPRRGKGLALHGYRLLGQGRYGEISPLPEGGVWLETVGLRVQAEAATHTLHGPLLRLTTPTGERLLHVDEEAEARRAERQRRHAAERARDAAQAEIVRLRALLGESDRRSSS
ncbi:MAG: hypothetical protein ACRDG4_10065, partial [Chloroflexota bacterium]